MDDAEEIKLFMRFVICFANYQIENGNLNAESRENLREFIEITANTYGLTEEERQHPEGDALANSTRIVRMIGELILPPENVFSLTEDGSSSSALAQRPTDSQRPHSAPPTAMSQLRSAIGVMSDQMNQVASAVRTVQQALNPIVGGPPPPSPDESSNSSIDSEGNKRYGNYQ